jgi:hypothetical protein
VRERTPILPSHKGNRKIVAKAFLDYLVLRNNYGIKIHKYNISILWNLNIKTRMYPVCNLFDLVEYILYGFNYITHL